MGVTASSWRFASLLILWRLKLKCDSFCVESRGRSFDSFRLMVATDGVTRPFELLPLHLIILIRGASTTPVVEPFKTFVLLITIAKVLAELLRVHPLHRRSIHFTAYCTNDPVTLLRICIGRRVLWRACFPGHVVAVSLLSTRSFSAILRKGGPAGNNRAPQVSKFSRRRCPKLPRFVARC